MSISGSCFLFLFSLLSVSRCSFVFVFLLVPLFWLELQYMFPLRLVFLLLLFLVIFEFWLPIKNVSQHFGNSEKKNKLKNAEKRTF